MSYRVFATHRTDEGVLHHAYLRRNFEVFQFLLASGADTSQPQGMSRETLLHRLARESIPDHFIVPMQEGIPVPEAITDYERRKRSIQTARAEQALKFMKALLDAGAETGTMDGGLCEV